MTVYMHEQDIQGYNALTTVLQKQRTNQDKRTISEIRQVIGSKLLFFPTPLSFGGRRPGSLCPFGISEVNYE